VSQTEDLVSCLEMLAPKDKGRHKDNIPSRARRLPVFPVIKKL
jgi:hypothetical protein